MLTHALICFYAMYEEEGTTFGRHSGTILQKNLTGLEIDDGGGGWPGFALT
ncbi:MAG: hypothetical protein IPH82_26775 [Chloroflexi bacterium]|nr:hypothetical protein [Chloroflexota bacterium]